MENKVCQNCKQDFVVDEADFLFYRKLNVPAPTFCPDCRFARRLLFRNERSMYRRNCDMCKKPTICLLAPEKPGTMYCPECWFGDGWDGISYGVEYDSSRPFFDQFRELLGRVPQLARVIEHSNVFNSEYINHAASCKNCVLLFNADFCENVLYSNAMAHAKDTMDCFGGDGMELCYEIVDGENNSRCFYGKSIISCVDTLFSRDVSGCINCFACINMRNKTYCAFNKQMKKEEYETLVASYHLDTEAGVQKAKKDAEAFFAGYPRRYMYGIKNQNVLGNYVYHSKNAKQCWMGQHYEDAAYCQLATLPYTRDTYDNTDWGENLELSVDTSNCGKNASGLKYCLSSWGNVRNLEYCMMCTGAVADSFGCVGLRKKQYCILNRQYTKEEYEKLREQIIKEMNERPYVDAKGRVWTYGDYFPYDISLYDYNESTAIQYFPLKKEDALSRGLTWRDIPKSSYETTILSCDLPQGIHDAPESVLKEIIECGECKMAYKILPEELSLLRRYNIPLPRSCSYCRQIRRLRQIGSHTLYERVCMCTKPEHESHAKGRCPVTFSTTYAPNTPEVVYCESCYQNEIL